MKTQVDVKYLARMCRLGDDNHRQMVDTITKLRSELSDAEFLVTTLEYELDRVAAENRFLMQKVQEEV